MTTDQTLELFLPFDRFRVLEVKQTLSDGRANSWMAEQKGSGRRVLVKWMDRAIDPEFDAWLARHDWIGWGRVAEVKRGPGQSFLVRDWIDGVTLHQLIGDGTTVVSEAHMRLVFARVCRVLSRLHQLGNAHGRLKPANLIAEGKNVYVTDPEPSTSGRRGLVPETTKEVEVDGDPHYMSPEQLRNEPVTPASDVYTLACVLYETLAGRPPFGHANPMMLCYLHFSAQPEPIWKFRSDITHSLEMLLRKCFAKDPAIRFSDAAELEAALMEGVEGYDAELTLAARYEDSLRLMSRLQQARALGGGKPAADTLPATPEEDAEKREALLRRLRQDEEKAAQDSADVGTVASPRTGESSPSRTKQLSLGDIRRAVELARSGADPGELIAKLQQSPIGSAPVPQDFEPIPSNFEFPQMDPLAPLASLDQMETESDLWPQPPQDSLIPSQGHNLWKLAFLLVLIYALAVTVILITALMRTNPPT